MAFIRDAIVETERSVKRLVSQGYDPNEKMPGGLITFGEFQALLIAAEQAQRLMTYTANDGEEKVVVVRGFGRDYARAMNIIRKHMGPNEVKKAVINE